MTNITKHYSNGEVTVVWKPDVCVHSKVCWNGLPAVFDPKARPWIAINGAETERIVEQVKRCPSGALTYYMNEAAEQEGAPDISAESVVETVPNGPLLVYGNIVVKDHSGQEVRKHKVTAFCRCGASGNKPFCDGSHVKAGFQG
ncbi:(4Fe-4S)-binding protein [Chitinophaga pendula]|uniref:(4Fe-4S)-binding protein n=1 Tax=Chitinophaga TaxID=79328 RepID=UPI000BB07C92|nr:MULTISPECIES: (4Fe-4S)-binding protein [Chitinophaga]ASZ12776.1 hypothetical protein CK934_18350 [Chitinophaga sp. MD30]UCJ09602.1 (4Fe-4S)-binding protein [Chitinophaga pendula]